MNYPKKYQIKKNSLKIIDLPFYWRVGTNNKVVNIPSRLEFNLYFDDHYGCLRQVLSSNLKNSLLEVYKQNENIGYLREDNTLAKKYHDDLLEFILNNTADISLKNVLEIGCGGCTILNYLKQRNIKVTGMDPSPFAVECGSNFKIKIIDNFFDKSLIKEDYDLTFFSDVLEHVFDPVSFLNDLSCSLQPGSKIIVAVPDATTEQLNGDISMCMHQHVTYFTENSLKNTFLKSGIKPIKVVKSGYGGSIYGLGEVLEKSEFDLIQEKLFNKKVVQDYNYFSNVEKVINKFNSIFCNALSKNVLFHCYCPLRAMPYLAAINQLSSKNIRFIDDTPFWENGFIDGSNTVIQPLKKADISINDIIFIFSNTFEEIIKYKLLKIGFKTSNIFSLSDLYL